MSFIYRLGSLVVLTALVYCGSKMLSKMMKDQARSRVSDSPKSKELGEINNKKEPNTTGEKQLVRNEQKRLKPNPNLKPQSSAHGTSITNWEKFKDIIKDSASSDDNKDKSKPQHAAKTFSRYKRNHNSVGSPTCAPSTGASAEEAKENKTMEKKRSLLTKQVAMDCEMVGIGDGTDSMLARISLVNRYGECIYDKYVKPREKILDYRTAVSGIRPHHLNNGEEFETVQKEVAEILNGRILVGHALKHDMDVLFLSHPRRMIRDTSRYKQFRKVSKGNTPSLKKLATELLGISIQTGEHNSVEDARTAMQLYVLYKSQWETDIRTKR